MRRDHASDRALNQVAESGGLLDSGGGLGAKMQIELAGIGGWKKILAEPRHQQKDRRAYNQERGEEQPTVADAAGRDFAIAVADRFESAFECSLKPRRDVPARGLRGVMAARFQQVHRQGRHESARKYIRSEHGENHALGQRYKKIPRHAGKKEHWQEDDAKTEIE